MTAKRRRAKVKLDVARRALIAVIEAEIARARADYDPLQARIQGGEELTDDLCDLHAEAAGRFIDAAERLEDARSGLEVAWPSGQGEPIGLAVIALPMR